MFDHRRCREALVSFATYDDLIGVERSSYTE